jgi:hypothetical protein
MSSISVPGKFITKFKQLQVGEVLLIPWEHFAGRPKGPATIGLGTRRVWEFKPTDDGLEIVRVK